MARPIDDANPPSPRSEAGNSDDHFGQGAFYSVALTTDVTKQRYGRPLFDQPPLTTSTLSSNCPLQRGAVQVLVMSGGLSGGDLYGSGRVKKSVSFDKNLETISIYSPPVTPLETGFEPTHPRQASQTLPTLRHTQQHQQQQQQEEQETSFPLPIWHEGRMPVLPGGQQKPQSSEPGSGLRDRDDRLNEESSASGQFAHPQTPNPIGRQPNDSDKGPDTRPWWSARGGGGVSNEPEARKTLVSDGVAMGTPTDQSVFVDGQTGLGKPTSGHVQSTLVNCK